MQWSVSGEAAWNSLWVEEYENSFGSFLLYIPFLYSLFSFCCFSSSHFLLLILFFSCLPFSSSSIFSAISYSLPVTLLLQTLLFPISLFVFFAFFSRSLLCCFHSSLFVYNTFLSLYALYSSSYPLSLPSLFITHQADPVLFSMHTIIITYQCPFTLR
jgi:hypothetical protein